MTKASKDRYGIPPGFVPNPEELRQMQHILRSIAREIEVLNGDGMPVRSILVALLVNAIKLAMHSKGVPPAMVRAMFDHIMARETEETEE
jgi:hypothetical protein